MSANFRTFFVSGIFYRPTDSSLFLKEFSRVFKKFQYWRFSKISRNFCLLWPRQPEKRIWKNFNFEHACHFCFKQASQKQWSLSRCIKYGFSPRLCDSDCFITTQANLMTNYTVVHDMHHRGMCILPHN